MSSPSRVSDSSFRLEFPTPHHNDKRTLKFRLSLDDAPQSHLVRFPFLVSLLKPRYIGRRSIDFTPNSNNAEQSSRIKASSLHLVIVPIYRYHNPEMHTSTDDHPSNSASATSTNSTTSNSTPVATFHPFPRLPNELRHVIWELSVACRLVRTVDGTIRFTCGTSKCLDPRTTATCPCYDNVAILQVNKESRALLTKHFRQFWFQLDSRTLGDIRTKSFHFSLENDLLCVGNVGSSDGARIISNFFEKVRYVYMPIGGLRVQSNWQNNEHNDLFLRLPNFNNLQHLFVILTGLPTHLKNGRLQQQINELIQRVRSLNSDWNVPSWTMVENEEKLLELWQGWKK
ncbi:uncharacterized protein PAC_04755 [Phialocephala subalpina]|uniref:2EXR domain-containing protein n=1 Tax=Phialocephala subalpina TaxID=576137 RepID=A0A1L7WQ27_9HELO|nr:uncharacterized protein PAC_04755 [Phialocephala subalpina]